MPPEPLPAYSPDPRRPRVRTAEDLERALAPASAERLLQLFLEGPAITGELVARVAARPDLRELKTLSLGGLSAGDAALAVVARGRALRTLRLLVLDRCGLTVDGVRALASAAPTSLVTLTFRDTDGLGGEPNRVDDAAAKALAEATSLPLLEELDLSYNPLTAEGISALHASRQLPKLGRVTAWRTGLTEASVRSLGRLRFTLHSDFDARTISYSEE